MTEEASGLVSRSMRQPLSSGRASPGCEERLRGHLSRCHSPAPHLSLGSHGALLLSHCHTPSPPSPVSPAPLSCSGGLLPSGCPTQERGTGLPFQQDPPPHTFLSEVPPLALRRGTPPSFPSTSPTSNTFSCPNLSPPCTGRTEKSCHGD